MEKVRDRYNTNRGSMRPFYDVAEILINGPKSLKDLFMNVSKETPVNKGRLAFISDDRKIKYSEYAFEVSKRAKGLKDALKDIEKDSFVAFKVNNSIEWPLFFWGLVEAGYKPLLINPILSKEDTEKLIEEANAKAVVLDNDTEYSVPHFNIFNIDTKEEDKDDSPWADEIAFCTSGTTGDSRIFVYNGKTLIHQIYAAYDMPLISDDIMYIGPVRLLAIVPFSHIFGFVAVLTWYNFFGAAIVFPKSLAPNDLKEACIKHKCTHIYAVPLFWDMVAKTFLNELKNQSEGKQKLVHRMMDYNNDFITKYEAGIAKKRFVQKLVQKKILGDQVVYCIAGGSALSEKTLHTINGIGYHLYDGYGMTETGVTAVELSPDVNQRNRGSVGFPLYDVEFKLENNELLVKSPFLHVARLKDGKRLEPDIDKEGYFHTGDIAEIDKEGYVFIKGKKKDVVIGSNGENIYPDEIEIKFSGLPFVDNLAVLGIKDKSEELLTLVVSLERPLNEEEMLLLENSINEKNQTLPFAMQIRQCFVSKESLPMNSSMKIKKFILKEELESKNDNYVKLTNGATASFEEYDEKEVKEIIDHLINIFADVLFIDKNDIAPNSNINADLGGDSFSYMSIVSSVESEFNVKIPTDMIGRLLSASQFALFILKNKH
ncbi:MAG: non-ribosomal peptide synthetase [Bacilli bacterium]|nr:non-ribosomal peptide synthetase [Bacilli bacterium]